MYQYIPVRPTAQGTNTSQYTRLYKVSVLPSTPNCTRYQYIPIHPVHPTAQGISTSQYTPQHRVSVYILVHPTAQGISTSQYTQLHKVPIHPSTPKCTRYQYTSQYTQLHKVSIHPSTPSCTRHHYTPVYPTAQGIFTSQYTYLWHVCHCVLLDCESLYMWVLFLCYVCVAPTFDFEGNKEVFDFVYNPLHPNAQGMEFCHHIPLLPSAESMKLYPKTSICMRYRFILLHPRTNN